MQQDIIACLRAAGGVMPLPELFEALGAKRLIPTGKTRLCTCRRVEYGRLRVDAVEKPVLTIDNRARSLYRAIAVLIARGRLRRRLYSEDNESSLISFA